MILQYHNFIERLIYPHQTPTPNTDEPHEFGQRFGEACHHFNTPCAFAPLCSEPNPDDFLDRYLVSRWNPLEQSHG